jgi:hypothetical protein
MRTEQLKRNTSSYAVKKRERREYLESLIRKNYAEIGTYLSEISKLKLYKPDYQNFDSYCQEVWGHTKRWGERLIKASKFIEKLLPETLDLVNLIHLQIKNEPRFTQLINN